MYHRDDDDPHGVGVLGLLLRQNILDLMEWRHWKQVELAAKIGMEQPLLSKRMSGLTKFTVQDLEKLANAFELEACDLLRPGHGKHDRRKLHSRRSGRERRAVPRTKEDCA